MLGATLDAATGARSSTRLEADGAELRRPGGGDALDHAGLCRRQAGAAADEPARLPRPHRRTAGSHARRLRPHRRDAATPTAIAMQRGGQAADVWVVSRQARSSARRCCPASATGSYAQRRPACCRAAPPTTSSGSAAMSSAPKARCASCAPITCGSPRPPTPTLPLLADIARLSRAARHRRRRRRSRPACSTRSTAPISSAGHDPRPLLARRLAGAERPVEDRAQDSPRRSQPGDDAARAMTVLLRKIAGFSGLVHENMYRFTGWRFLEIGRSLERGIHDRRHARPGSPRQEAPDGALDMLLEIGDSVMTHRRRYAVQTGRAHRDRPAGARPAQPALGPLPARPS